MTKPMHIYPGDLASRILVSLINRHYVDIDPANFTNVCIDFEVILIDCWHSTSTRIAKACIEELLANTLVDEVYAEDPDIISCLVKIIEKAKPRMKMSVQ